MDTFSKCFRPCYWSRRPRSTPTTASNYIGVLGKYNIAFPNDKLTIAQIIQIGDSNSTRDSQNNITKLEGRN